jgi:hypothetical protein
MAGKIDQRPVATEFRLIQERDGIFLWRVINARSLSPLSPAHRIFFFRPFARN